MTPYTWEMLKTQKKILLYAGELTQDMPQFQTHIGLNPRPCSSRCIVHDVCFPMPLNDNSVEIYQSEDVFEHVEYGRLPAIFNEIFRVLRGGVFRLSLPDYRCDVLRERCIYDYHGNLVFDPFGGGMLRGLKVITGGHVWFPILETVLELFEGSMFKGNSTITVLRGYTVDGGVILKPIDYTLGHIKRTPDHDARVQNPRRPLSIVIDAVKTVGSV